MHFCLGGIEAGLIRPDLPGTDDLLAGFGGHRPAEIRLGPLGHEVLPTVHDLKAAISSENPGTFGRPRFIGIEIFLGHRDDQHRNVHGD